MPGTATRTAGRTRRLLGAAVVLGVGGSAALLLNPAGRAAAPVSGGGATRTWVSGVGDDANPCSRTAPCKTFAGAISKTAAGGEINVLDPGGFGAVTITKAITISAEGVEAGVLTSAANAINVAAGPTDVVVLRGLGRGPTSEAEQESEAAQQSYVAVRGRVRTLARRAAAAPTGRAGGTDRSTRTEPGARLRRLVG